MSMTVGQWDTVGHNTTLFTLHTLGIFHNNLLNRRKTVWWFFQNINTELLYDAAIPSLGIYPKELKAESRRDIYTPILIKAYS